MTEITDNINTDRDPAKGVIFFDAACSICRSGANRLHIALQRRGFRLLPLQSADATRWTGASPEELLREIHLVTASRKILRGIDALIYIAAAFAWTKPLAWIASMPGIHRLLQTMYRIFANHRYQIARSCRIGTSAGIFDRMARWLPAVLLIAISFIAGRNAASWIWMWAVAVSMFLACKWMLWWPVRRSGSIARNLAYFLAWPGMDAESFLTGPAPGAPTGHQWFAAMTNTATGAALVWVVTRALNPGAPFAAAWAGMIGLALFLHFGLMQLAALAWRRAGVAAEPLMQQPTRSISLADFWSRRWNTGFRFIAHDLIFMPLLRPLGVTAATAVVFLVSGFIHDAVISVPARGGYGLPTLYFLIQLAGLLLERTRIFRPWIRRATFGRLYAIVFVVAPLPLLFHAAFVHNVIVPFLHAIGGLP